MVRRATMAAVVAMINMDRDLGNDVSCTQQHPPISASSPLAKDAPASLNGINDNLIITELQQVVNETGDCPRGNARCQPGRSLGKAGLSSGWPVSRASSNRQGGPVTPQDSDRTVERTGSDLLFLCLQ
jgi:hypothetical protein